MPFWKKITFYVYMFTYIYINVYLYLQIIHTHFEGDTPKHINRV